MNKEQKLPTSRQTIFQEATTLQPIENLIFEIRGQQVMLDRDLAMLYGVPTGRMNEQVKRNIARFPESFRFQLTECERDEVIAFCDNLQKLKYSVYHIGASLKDLGKKWFAFSKMQIPTDLLMRNV